PWTAAALARRMAKTHRLGGLRGHHRPGLWGLFKARARVIAGVTLAMIGALPLLKLFEGAPPWLGWGLLAAAGAVPLATVFLLVFGWIWPRLRDAVFGEQTHVYVYDRGIVKVTAERLDLLDAVFGEQSHVSGQGCLWDSVQEISDD